MGDQDTNAALNANNRVHGVDPGAGDDHTVVLRPCRFCDAPVEQPTGRHRKLVKDFCSPKHRAAFREREHQKALALAVEAIDNAEGAVGQAMAQLQGARAALERFQKKQ